MEELMSEDNRAEVIRLLEESVEVTMECIKICHEIINRTETLLGNFMVPERKKKELAEAMQGWRKRLENLNILATNDKEQLAILKETFRALQNSSGRGL